MHIQFNSDSSIEGKDALFAKIRPDVEKVLARFEDHITRLEVHVTDINGERQSDNDIRAVVRFVVRVNSQQRPPITPAIRVWR